MYFDKFPKILYEYYIKNKSQFRVVTDITRNLRVLQEVLNNVTLYDEYDMQDGETPEIVADKFYGSSEYHWVVMLVNQRYDYIDDFVLPTFEFEKYIDTKYGFTEVFWNAADISALDTDNDTFNYTAHPFNTGDRVIYDMGSGSPIGGLTNGLGYFVIRTTDNQFKLASSLSNAQNNISLDITSGGIGVQSLRLNNQFNIHHYEDEAGNVVNETYIDFDNITRVGIPVTNYQFEERQNEAKRRIKIISNDMLKTLLKNFDDII
jgi:hypothetical protein